MLTCNSAVRSRSVALSVLFAGVKRDLPKYLINCHLTRTICEWTRLLRLCWRKGGGERRRRDLSSVCNIQTKLQAQNQSSQTETTPLLQTTLQTAVTSHDIMKMLLAHLIGLLVSGLLGSSLASALPLLSGFEGSTDEEELFSTAASFPTLYLFTELPEFPSTRAPAGPRANADALKRVEDFLRENTLLIIVAITLVFLVFLIVCGAILMSRKQKLNAYYPSSFPSKMYVDHRDKTGGAKPFHEVPESESQEQIVEPMDSHKQLQADIMRAARSLRTPNKTALSDRRDDRGPEETLKTHDSSVLDAMLPSLPEEELCQLSVSDAEAVSSEESIAEKSESQRIILSRNSRPPSLQTQESATLQLIEGEKTAF